MRKLLHWVKGESNERPETTLIPVEQPSPNPPFTIEVKENLVSGRWSWILKDNTGKYSRYAYNSVPLTGTSGTRSAAIKKANEKIAELKAIERNQEQKWEDIDVTDDTGQ